MRFAIVIPVLLLVTSGVAHAQCLPDPNFSVCQLNIIDNDACPTTFPPTLIWCPAGDMSKFEIYIQLRDASNNLCVNTNARIVVNLSGIPATAGNALFGCGFDNVGFQDWAVTTDANGEARIEFWGGGCGCLNVNWQVFSSGAITCSGFGSFCVKSPDLTGDGKINFFDTFQFLPCLQTSTGYCCDFNCDNTVNFFDVFQYLPHLSGAHSCPGNIIPIGVPCGQQCN